MAAASGDRPIQNVLGNPNDFNDLYRPPSLKVVVFYNRERQNSNTGAILILRIGSAASIATELSSPPAPAISPRAREGVRGARWEEGRDGFSKLARGRGFWPAPVWPAPGSGLERCVVSATRG